METRGFNPQSKSTHLLRSKESAPDYRYLPEADLPTIKLNQVADSSICT
jgi:aspartyl-tRNA(Asn)/glutamyl-tRNA(Gln) amidotransferase subunit B